MSEILKLIVWAVVFAALGAGLTWVVTMRAVKQTIDERHPSQCCGGMVADGVCVQPYGHDGACR